MKKLNIVTILIMLSLSPILNFAQNNVPQSDLLERLIENLAEQSEENLDYTNLLEHFNNLFNNPINLNSANFTELKKLYFLSNNQINNLILYREKTGQILSIFELQVIPGFSYELIRNIESLISLKPINQELQLRKKSSHQLLLKTEKTIETEAGYKTDNENTSYIGSPWKYYTRYLYQSKNRNFEGGFTAEKDKGEPFFQNKNKNGFDYYSAHFQLKSKGVFQQLNAGDYHIKVGQGLTLWSGMATGKTSFVTNNANKYQGVRSYRSTDENNFFRGIATILNPIKNTSFTIFYSDKKRDANLRNDTTTSFISSILNTGYHRSKNELNKKHKLNEKIMGGIIHLNSNKFALGLCYLRYEYSKEILPQHSPYKLFNYKGKRNYNIGINYETHLKSIHLFGEAAKSKSGGIAVIQGLNIQAHPQLNFEIIYRKYAKDYHAHFANGFGEGSHTRNEEGIYIGAKLNPLPKWTVLAYFDMFEFPWLKSNVYAPAEGHEYFSQVEFTPTKSLSLYLRLKQKNKPENISSEKNKSVVITKKNQYRFHLSYQINKNWEIRNRMEWSAYQKERENEKGFLFYQDLLYHFEKIPINISCRYAIFDTDSYNTRIYTYENDVLHAYSIPTYQDKGSRFYLNVNYKVGRYLKFYARYSVTKFFNKELISSGTSEIIGSTRSEFKLMAKLRF
jgi:hypothetical protein